MSVLDRQDYVVISKHENGYWMAEAFWKREKPPTEVDVSNHQKTFRPEQSVDDALSWIKDWYMHAEIIVERGN